MYFLWQTRQNVKEIRHGQSHEVIPKLAKKIKKGD